MLHFRGTVICGGIGFACQVVAVRLSTGLSALRGAIELTPGWHDFVGRSQLLGADHVDERLGCFLQVFGR